MRYSDSPRRGQSRLTRFWQFDKFCKAGLSPLAASLLLATCLSAATPQQNAPAPDAAIVQKGREIFGQTCSGCHGASHTLIQRKSKERWLKTIYTMISRGAPVLPSEIEPLNIFLAATYGPNSPAPAFGENAASRPQQALPAGSEVLVRSCGGCHAINLVLGARKSQSAWSATVKQMRANGAPMTDAEEQEIVKYLTEHFGSQ